MVIEKKLTINVTQEDIDGGCQTDGSNCPNALAVARALMAEYFPGQEDIPSKADIAAEVGSRDITQWPRDLYARYRDNHLDVHVTNAHVQMQVVKDGKTVVMFQNASLPRDVRLWIHSYDREVEPDVPSTVKPITWELVYWERQ